MTALGILFIGLSLMAQTTQPASRPATSSAPASRPAATQPSNRVVVETNLGDIVIELTPDRTPATVKNFLRYVDEGFYNGTIFHRVMPGFMIQGGGFTPDLVEKATHEPVVNESAKGLSNTRGTIAMARTPDPNSATSQFFINVADNKRLDYPRYGGYCAFGRVIEGMDVADKISTVPTHRAGPHEAVPVETVEIRSIRRK